MSKIIVNKTEIKLDPKLAIVKAFRVTNKRAGEYKLVLNDATKTDVEKAAAAHEYEQCCRRLKELAETAESMGYHLWVNFDGRTGHTYEKDYKVTDDECNNVESFTAQLANHLNEVNDVANRAVQNHLGEPSIN